MNRPYRLIEVETRPDTVCIHLRKPRMEEEELEALMAEILDAQEAAGAFRVALSLGPKNPILLYSVFLARLVGLQRLLKQRGCAFFLCHVSPVLMSVFTVTALDRYFHFVADFDEASSCEVPSPAAG